MECIFNISGQGVLQNFRKFLSVPEV